MRYLSSLLANMRIPMSIRNFPRLVSMAVVFLTAACSVLTPYKLPIQQGNIVTAESIAKLKSGMTKNQVTQVLGTPMVNDVFHVNRWDYVHYLNKRGTMSEQNHLALIFEDGKLAGLLGEKVPVLEPMSVPIAHEPAETK